MAKAPRVPNPSASDQIPIGQIVQQNLFNTQQYRIENGCPECGSRKIIELIPQGTREYRFQTERLRNILRLRGYSKKFIASAFQSSHLARTSTGLALIPCSGDVTSVMVLGEGFALVASFDGGEP